MDHLYHEHETMRRPSLGHEAALRSVQKPPSKPWRAGGGAGGLTTAPTPPSVYCVEPREFRDLVQRLTGAPATARQQHNLMLQQPQQQLVALAPTRPVAVRADGEGVAGAQLYAAVPWCSDPPMPPTAVHPGLDRHHLL